MPKRRLLVTNDDGFDSFFLRVLVDRLLEKFEVTVVAPKDEQSWIGRGISRRHGLRAAGDDSLGCPGWRVSGTPTDCVNIALEHLCEQRPDAVVSGINLGFNTTVPLVLSSGTIAGALEGSFSGIPAIALSKMIPKEIFEEIRSSNGFVEGDFFESLENAAAHSIRMVEHLLSGQWKFYRGIVHNINFPIGTRPTTEWRRTIPVNMKMRGLFEKKGEEYFFRYRPGVMPDDYPGTDIHALEEGFISHSVIDFTRMGVPG